MNCCVALTPSFLGTYGNTAFGGANLGLLDRDGETLCVVHRGWRLRSRWKGAFESGWKYEGGGGGVCSFGKVACVTF